MNTGLIDGDITTITIIVHDGGFEVFFVKLVLFMMLVTLMRFIRMSSEASVVCDVRVFKMLRLFYFWCR